MEKPTGSAPSGGKDQVEKQARQLAYDVRYKVRQSLKAQSGGKSDPATVRKAYLSQLGKSPASPPVKARAKSMLLGEDYVNVNKLATESAVSALYRVFVEGIQEEVIEENKEKTYKIRVTDKKSGNSYVRMASREKITDLRNNPNISSVEMTGYGEPTKSEKYKGKSTAAAKAGKDFDGDGKKESSSKEHAGVVHNAIQKKKGGVPDGKDTRKEDYGWKDGFSELIEKKKEEKKITGKGVNNKKLIKVFPVQEGMADTLTKVINKKDEAQQEDPGGTQKQVDAKQKKADQIKKQVLLKKLQAVRMGGGEDIVASHQPEGEVVEAKVDTVKYGVMSSPEKEKARNERKFGKVGWNQGGQSQLRKGVHWSKRGEKKVRGAKEVEEDAKYGYDKEGNSLNPKDKKKKEEQEDPRSMGTKYRNIKNRLRSMGLNMSYEPQGDSVDELNRYGKETGKATGSLNKRPGSAIKPKGDEPGALRNVRGMIRKETGKPEGQKRRDYDNRHSAQNRPESPASTITKRREAVKRANDAIMDTRGT